MVLSFTSNITSSSDSTQLMQEMSLLHERIRIAEGQMVKQPDQEPADIIGISEAMIDLGKRVKIIKGDPDLSSEYRILCRSCKLLEMHSKFAESLQFKRDYQILENSPLGRGAVVKAFPAIRRDNEHLKVAVLINHKKIERDYQDMLKQASNLRELQYAPYFPRLLHAFDIAPGKYALVQEILPANLYRTYLQNVPHRKDLKWNELLNFVLQTSIALDCLHKKGLIHCDVKPENMYFDPATGHATLSDLSEAREQEAMYTQDSIGTSFYRDPWQILRLGGGSGFDIWSLGCVIAEIITKKHPFHPGCSLDTRQTEDRLLKNIFLRKGIPPKELRNPRVDAILAKLPSDLEDKFSEEMEKDLEKAYPEAPKAERMLLAYLVSDMLSYAYEERPRAEEVYRCPLLNKSYLYLDIVRDPQWLPKGSSKLKIQFSINEDPIFQGDLHKHANFRQLLPRSKDNRYRISLYDERGKKIFTNYFRLIQPFEMRIGPDGVQILPLFPKSKDAPGKDNKEEANS